MGAGVALGVAFGQLSLLMCILLFCVPALDSSCDFDECWLLYQAAQEYIRDYYPVSKVTSMTARNAKCKAHRTFHNCLQNMSRSCHSDLSFHGAKSRITDKMNYNNCSKHGDVFEYPFNGISNPDMTVCSYGGPRVYRHCGLFGDPHLHTFIGDFQTCSVAGAWPLLNNNYLTVQVTNEPVGLWEGQKTATATTQVTVMVKRKIDCGPENFVTYQAQVGNIPNSFDGARTLGPESAVLIKELESNKHVEIHILYIGTTVVIRQIGNFLTFAMKMPELVVNESLRSIGNAMDLCIVGCPSNEIIDYKSILSGRRTQLADGKYDLHPINAVNVETAIHQCQMENVTDVYFDFCVFDLMTSGDKNFAIAAYYALYDALHLNPDILRFRENRTHLESYSHIPFRSGSLASYRILPSCTNLHYIHRTTFVLLTLVLLFF